MTRKYKELDAFIDTSIKKSIALKYTPRRFIDMRNVHGTVGAIIRLVGSGALQSGLKRMKPLGLLKWSLEQAVIKFPDIFGPQLVEVARWRLRLIKASKRS